MTEVREQTNDWDMEHHFTLLGLQLKVKYEDVNNMLAGAHVFVDWTLPGVLPHFLFGVSRLQMDVMLQAPQGATIDMALMDAKIGYKFWRFGVEHSGTVEIARKIENGRYITKMVVNLKETTIVEIIMETDHKNKLHITCTVSGTPYEFKINRVRGTSYIISTPSIPQIGLKSLTFVITPSSTLKKIEVYTTVGNSMSNKMEIIYNPIQSELGLYLNGDINDAPLMCRFVLAKDLKFAQAYISYNNVNYLMFNMEGRIARTGLIPTFLRYTISYDIMKGQWGEGKAKINYDALKAEKTLSISVVPKTGHAYEFEMKVKVEGEVLELSHELVQDKTIIYAASHKITRVENTAQKLMITVADKNTIPRDSPLRKLLDGIIHKNSLGHMKRKIVFTLDYTVKNGLPFGIYYKETVMANGALNWNIVFDTMTAPYKMTFFYPYGPEIRGINFGMQYFFGKDGMTAVIEPVVVKGKVREFIITQDLNDMRTAIKLPSYEESTTFSFSVVRADAKTGEKTIDLTVYKDGLLYKVNFFTNILTPTMPYLCTERECKWTASVNYDIDLATKIAGLIPANTLAVTLERNAEPLLELQHNFKTAPFFCRMSCPLVLPKPIEVSAEYVPNTHLVLRAADYLPGEIVMEIMEPKYVIKYEADVQKKAPALATIMVDLATRQLRLNFAFIRSPVLDISWTKNTLMTNKMTVVTILPVLGKVMDLVVDYTVVEPLVVECKVTAGVRLPVFGVLEVEQEFNWQLNKILRGSKMYSIRVSTGNTGLLSFVPEMSCSYNLDYNIPTKSISSSIKTRVNSEIVEISVHNYSIFLMSNNVIV